MTTKDALQKQTHRNSNRYSVIFASLIITRWAKVAATTAQLLLHSPHQLVDAEHELESEVMKSDVRKERERKKKK